MTRARVLLVAEAVTLAQVVRLVKLGASLDPERYDVHFAASYFDPLVFEGTTFTRHSIRSLGSAVVDHRLRRGQRLYGYRTLVQYAESDLELMRKVRPDLVVGDFRWSLPVSARVARIPCATLVNAYWSPYRAVEDFPVPDHPIVSVLGERVTERYFPRALPRVFDYFARPAERLRSRFGLEPAGSLLETLSAGDYTLYPDHPVLTPLKPSMPAHHKVLGPVLWSAPVSLPVELQGFAPEEPLVYATLGSSGRADRLPLLIAALGSLRIQAIVATAGRARVPQLPQNVRVVDFAPGAELARNASVVISNGGSTTGYQALNEGTPVVGLPSNLDQHLAMRAIERAGAGVSLPARSLTVEGIRVAVRRVLGDSSYGRAAKTIRNAFTELDSSVEFNRLVEQVTSRSRSPADGPDP